MRRRLQLQLRLPRGRAVAAVFASVLSVASMLAVGCDTDGRVDAAGPDARLRTHEVQPSTPSAEGLAYLQAIATAHRAADAASPSQRVSALRAALAEPVPANLPEAEILRLETATRLAEVLLDGSDNTAPQSAPAVVTSLLLPLLEPERSLPLDRSTARALVVLGDAAAKTGDDALAAGSYARAIRMMSMLRQELER